MKRTRELGRERYKENYHGPECPNCGYPHDPGGELVFLEDSTGEATDGNPFCSTTCLEAYYTIAELSV